MLEIRSALEGDIPALAPIERAAGEAFRALGMNAIADDEPLPASVLRHAASDRRLLVAVIDERIVGYLLAEPLVDSLQID